VIPYGTCVPVAVRRLRTAILHFTFTLLYPPPPPAGGEVASNTHYRRISPAYFSGSAFHSSTVGAFGPRRRRRQLDSGRRRRRHQGIRSGACSAEFCGSQTRRSVCVAKTLLPCSTAVRSSQFCISNTNSGAARIL